MTPKRRTLLTAAAATTLGAPIALAQQRRLFDSHFHIIDPRFPIVPNQGYTPPTFTLDDYLALARPLGVVAGAVVSGSSRPTTRPTSWTRYPGWGLAGSA